MQPLPRHLLAFVNPAVAIEHEIEHRLKINFVSSHRILFRFWRPFVSSLVLSEAVLVIVIVIETPLPPPD